MLADLENGKTHNAPAKVETSRGLDTAAQVRPTNVAPRQLVRGPGRCDATRAQRPSFPTAKTKLTSTGILTNTGKILVSPHF